MSQKIAVFADVHGNYTALKAMYEDSLQQGVDQYWFMGDLFLPGPGAINVWQLMRKMAPQYIVCGNWDDLAVRGAAGKMDLEKPSHVYFARLAQWLAGQLPSTVFQEIAEWPLHQTVTAGSLKLSLAHNLPKLNMGQHLFPTNDSANFMDAFLGQEDVAIYAHVHHELMRYASDERLVLNPGSVGEPFNHWPRLQSDLRARYLLLTVDEIGLENIEFRHVAYQRELEWPAANKAGIPYLELYHKQLETGLVYTHDQELVNHYNQQYHYADEYRQYQQSLTGGSHD